MMSEREPTVLAPRDSRPNPIGQAFSDMVSQAASAIRSSASASDVEYADLDANAKSLIDETIERLKPELQKKADALITAEIRDRLAKYADLKHLSKMLAKNKTVSLKRKKGCIYLQFGQGEPDDPIEEYVVMMT